MTETMTLDAQPLTQTGFAAFGDVIEMAGHDSFAINQGMAERYPDLAVVDVTAHDGRTAIGLVRAQPETAPVRLRLGERHPLASQAFIPLGPQPFLVVVAPAGPIPAREALQAFISNGRQGINYHKGVWHHPMIALEAVTDFLVVDRIGPATTTTKAQSEAVGSWCDDNRMARLSSAIKM
jgi:ureidoglycolate lyase